MKEIERRMEMKNREERKKNLVMTGVEVREGKVKKAVKEIFKYIGVRVDIKEIRIERLKGGER